MVIVCNLEITEGCNEAGKEINVTHYLMIFLKSSQNVCSVFAYI